MISDYDQGRAHASLAEHLVPDLMRAFEGKRSVEEVRACSEAVVASYADVPVRSFVAALAHRRIRVCQRRERCAFLPG
jgi:hypothetical protein